MEWLESARRPVGEVALALGLQGASRGSFACPACRAERRDRRRGAAGSRPDGAGWRCHRCGAGGDCFDLVSLHLCGARFRDLSPDERRRVRAWFGAEPATLPTGRTSPAAWQPARCEPTFPPRGEVEQLWRASLPLASCLPTGSSPDTTAARFLADRGLLPLADAVAEADLARLTPPVGTYPCPSWWPAGRLGLWRLVVRAWRPGGEAVSLHARAVVARPMNRGESLPRQLWPRGVGERRFDACGLFFADPQAQRLLRGVAADIEQVLLCEGLTDWLSAAAMLHQRQLGGVAVLGGVSGSFPALAQIRWPVHPIDLVVAVDEDAAGERYLAQVRAALPGRPLRRLRLQEPT